MSIAKLQAPDTNAGHAGRGAIGATVVTAAVATGGHRRRVRMMAPAKRPLARRQDGCTTGGRIGADGLHNAPQRVGRRRLAFSVLTGGRS
jgi:hypothetical protein